MSPPDFVLELSALAQADFRDVLSYTLQMWGDRQLHEYRDLIDGALKELTRKPETGHQRSGSNYRFARAGKHLIFYRIDGRRVLVARILHAQMDLNAHLTDE